VAGNDDIDSPIVYRAFSLLCYRQNDLISELLNLPSPKQMARKKQEKIGA
jgi:hypothetical protein